MEERKFSVTCDPCGASFGSGLAELRYVPPEVEIIAGQHQYDYVLSIIHMMHGKEYNPFAPTVKVTVDYEMPKNDWCLVVNGQRIYSRW